IELIGIKMEGNAWDWFQRNVEDQLYGENPPTWEIFKQAVMNEFLPTSERQNRALQFDRLRQTYGMSVFDYAREFIRLSKYAPGIVPTEAARVERFRSGLIAPLYNAVLAVQSPTLSGLIDKAKQWETRNREEREREQRRKTGQSSRGQSERASFPPRQTEHTAQSAPQSQQKSGQGRGQSHNTPVFSSPITTQSSVRLGPQQFQPQRNICSI